jgi:hypothetical protein
MPGSRYPDNVEVGGLLLCANTTDQIKRRTEYYRRETARQMKSVNDQLHSEEDPRFRTMFHEEQRSYTAFGPDARRDRSGPKA